MVAYYSWKNCFLAFRLGYMMNFSRTFTVLLWRKEEILTKFSLLCKSSDKFVPKWKLLASNNEAILTYWTLNNTIFTFHKGDFPTFKLLNYLDRIYLMSYKKYLNGKSEKWIEKIKITFVFYFPRTSTCNCQGTDVFSNTAELLLLLFSTSMSRINS